MFDREATLKMLYEHWGGLPEEEALKQIIPKKVRETSLPPGDYNFIEIGPPAIVELKPKPKRDVVYVEEAPSMKVADFMLPDALPLSSLTITRHVFEARRKAYTVWVEIERRKDEKNSLGYPKSWVWYEWVERNTNVLLHKQM